MIKVLQLILSAVTAVALVIIAVQISKIRITPEPVVNIAAPQIPAPIIEQVVAQVNVPTPEIQTVKVEVPAPIIETVKVNVPTPEFSGNMTVTVNTLLVERHLKDIKRAMDRVSNTILLKR